MELWRRAALRGLYGPWEAPGAGPAPEIEIYYRCNFGSRFVRSGHTLGRVYPTQTAQKEQFRGRNGG